ncbi:hypothetical protein AAF134_02480 [Synechococcus lacustris Tous-12m]
MKEKLTAGDGLVAFGALILYPIKQPKQAESTATKGIKRKLNNTYATPEKTKDLILPQPREKIYSELSHNKPETA